MSSMSVARVAGHFSFSPDTLLGGSPGSLYNWRHWKARLVRWISSLASVTYCVHLCPNLGLNGHYESHILTGLKPPNQIGTGIYTIAFFSSSNTHSLHSLGRQGVYGQHVQHLPRASRKPMTVTFWNVQITG